MSTTLRRNRGGGRPPWDPSAAYRPKNALEKQAMKSLQFRNKVQNANANSICNATSEYVGRMSLRRLLIMDKFCVPVFQRRYCWTQVQWRTLFEDAEGSSVGRQHSLGRLTCTETNDNNKNNAESPTNNKTLVGVPGRSCILDGQQRFTTVTLLLAAIRDQLEKLQGGGNGFAGTIDSINSILFCDLPKMKEWKNQQHTLNEGIELPFARLVPTFCDRLAYYKCILPAGSVSFGDADTPSSLPRPLQAKQFFDQALDGMPEPKVVNFLQRVLDGLSMLYFPVDTNTNQRDGTDDLMVIYERLALRDATFCKPKRDEEYRGMDGSDLIRNLLLGSFSNETDSLHYYNQFWLPLEQVVAASADDGNNGGGMTHVLQAFLDSQKQQQGTGGAAAADDNNSNSSSDEVQSGIIGGQIYAEFQVWFANRLATTSQVTMDDETLSGGVGIEEKVQQVGKDLLEFARVQKDSNN